MVQVKSTRKTRKALASKMDQFLTASSVSPEHANANAGASLNASEANTAERGPAGSREDGTEYLTSGLSCENINLLREVRCMIQDDVQGEMRKVGADVLTIKEVLEMLTAEVSRLGARVTEAEDRVSRLEDKNKLLTNQVQSMEKTVKQLQTRVKYHENYSRRNNLRLRGIPEGRGNGQDEMACVKDILNSLFSDTGEATDALIIERAHRIPTGPKQEQRGPRNILVKFLRFTEKKSAHGLKSLRHSSGRILEWTFSRISRERYRRRGGNSRR